MEDHGKSKPSPSEVRKWKIFIAQGMSTTVP